ncbi:MAG TPA: hypothetical protein VMV46_19310 [Thermoanaerobaculia bacterium]|nr:hypothetical protein [Thermoanaerobaculia bacterium]
MTAPRQTDGRPSLEEILRRLPPERVGDGFTARVVAAARERRPRRGVGGLVAPLAVAGATAAAALAGFLLAPRLLAPEASPVAVPPPGARGEVRADGAWPRRVAADGESEALRTRMAELERQLADLQRLAAEQQPLIAIEGDHADYLIDLRDFLPTTRGGRTMPAGLAAEPRGR